MGDNKNYEVVKVYIKSSKYNLLILRIPKEEINDLLGYLTREKGLVAKSLYDDFLIAHCVSNVHQFIQHLSNKGTNLEKLNEVRAEMVEQILEINKALRPENLIINGNGVVKSKSESDEADEFIPLIENDLWKIDIYKETQEQVESENKKLDRSRIKNIKDLNYIVVEKFWQRINQYVLVKQFEPGSEEIILSDRGFDTKIAFQQYIVTICVDDVEELFIKLDKMGLPGRVPPSDLIGELYELCVLSNPFLSYEVYREVFLDDDFEDEEDIRDPFNPFQQAQSGSERDPFAKKEKNKLFKHVAKEALLNLGDNMKKKVVGHDKAINLLVDSIQRASVGLKDLDNPIGSFIFTGRSGIGKTYAAKVLCEELIGGRRNLVRIDCSEYSADHEYAKLIGAPSGYIGHDQGGYLTNAIKKHPFSVVLFDEIEKASDKVHQLLLQIMDEARLTDGKGKHVSFRDAVIIMTSNVGVSEVKEVEKTIGFGDVSKVTDEKQSKAVGEALKKKFKPEFLNRITATINFGSLTKKNYLEIVKLELDKLKLNLKLNRTEYSTLTLHFDKSLHEFIYEKGIDEKYGARPLKRAIEREVSTPLARKLLAENIDRNSEITVSIKRKKLHIDVKPMTVEVEVVDPPFYMANGVGNE